MKKDIRLKPIDTIELEFRDKEQFLKWREKILENYEQSKLDYKEEMRNLFGYDKEQEE